MEVSDAFQIINKQLSAFFGRYHFLLFIVLAAGGLAVATFLLYQVVTTPKEEPTASTSASFDTQTIERIRQLNTTEQSPDVVLPSGRTNPF